MSKIEFDKSDYKSAEKAFEKAIGRNDDNTEDRDYKFDIGSADCETFKKFLETVQALHASLRTYQSLAEKDLENLVTIRETKELVEQKIEEEVQSVGEPG